MTFQKYMINRAVGSSMRVVGWNKVKEKFEVDYGLRKPLYYDTQKLLSIVENMNVKLYSRIRKKFPEELI